MSKMHRLQIISDASFSKTIQVQDIEDNAFDLH